MVCAAKAVAGASHGGGSGDCHPQLSPFGLIDTAKIRAADAHLRMADAQVGLKKYEQAETEYDFVLQKYPESDTSRAALLKKGLALAEHDKPQAITTLNEVVKKFPNTSEAASAQARLKELQQPTRRSPAR